MRTLPLVLAACVPPADELPDWDSPDGTDLLVDRAWDAFPERIQPLGVPAARLLPDGPELRLEGPADAGFLADGRIGPLVVVDPTPWPRVVVGAGDLDVLVYVDRAALEPRVVGRVDGTGPDGDGRVRLPVGTPVERLGADGERVRVAAELRWLSVEAWLPAAAIDEVWVDEPDRTAPPAPTEGPTRALADGAVVLDRPNGDVLVAVAGPEDPWLEVVVAGDDERGWVPVAFEVEGLAVDGWVHRDDLWPEAGSWGWSRCGGSGTIWIGGGVFGDHAALVEPGALLRAGPDGPVVGRVTRTIRVWAPSAREEGATIERSTQLGTVSLWVAPEDVR